MYLCRSFRNTVVLATLLVAVRAGCPDDELDCGDEHKPCTHDEDSCCDGLDCFGYNFFKRCQEPPVCLAEFYDCNNSDIDCCDGMMCVTRDNGLKECQREKPGTRTVDLPGYNAQEHVDPPPPEPPINGKVTKQTPVTFNKACLSGDPHITTFDGLRWDCQSVGEHIILKSTQTRRQIQGRFIRVGERNVSVMQGIVIQDEGGKAIPKVQLTMPYTDDHHYTPIGDKGCSLQFFVNDVPQDLVGGYKDNQVEVTLRGTNIHIKYTESEMLINVRMGYWNGCLLNACVDIPSTDTVVGMLGSPDRPLPDINNDWMTRDGTTVPVPANQIDRLKKTAYEYCRNNWCLQHDHDRAESLFYYNEVGYDFGHFSRCALEYGESLAEFMEDVDQDILKVCQQDLACIIDAMQGGLPAARQAKFNQLELRNTVCKTEGGACDAGCCNGFTCVNTGFEKKCSATPLKALKCMVSPKSCEGHRSFLDRKLSNKTSALSFGYH